MQLQNIIKKCRPAKDQTQTRLWQCHTFWIATVDSRTTTTSFERSRSSCLRSASTRTCDQCTDRFTLASCCCTYHIQAMRASVPVIEQYCTNVHFRHAAASLQTATSN